MEACEAAEKLQSNSGVITLNAGQEQLRAAVVDEKLLVGADGVRNSVEEAWNTLNEHADRPEIGCRGVNKDGRVDSGSDLVFRWRSRWEGNSSGH